MNERELPRRIGRPPGSGTKPIELRHCAVHGESEFALYGRKRPRWRCKRCVGEAVTRRKRRVRAALIAAGGGRCAMCGYRRCSQNLHFHHVDPSRERLELSSHCGAALDIFLVELEKCVLLCANCHGEVEAGLVRSPPAGAVFGHPAAVADPAVRRAGAR